VVPADIRHSEGVHCKRAVNALWSSNDGTVLVSGDRDGKVVVWRVGVVPAKEGSTAELSCCAEFTLSGYSTTVEVEGGLNMATSEGKGKGGRGKGKGQGKSKAGAKVSAPVAPPVRALAMSDDLSRLLVGTQTCEVLEYVLCRGGSFARTDNLSLRAQDFDSSRVVSGHCRDEVWGLAVCPGGGGQVCMS
ncbi:hypothetical protein B484DRAFT_389717, partial [Ochromonadaceae sp. CCMP2298]